MVVPTGVPSVGAAAMVAGPKSAYAKYVLQNPALMQQVRQAHSTLAALLNSFPSLGFCGAEYCIHASTGLSTCSWQWLCR